LGKFDSKSNEEIFLRYSEVSKAYRIYNSRTSIVEELIHVRFSDYKPDKKLSVQEDSHGFHLQEL